MTEWPWYSYVAPVSWMIEDDVRRGRSHMDLSRWEEYTADQRIALLEQIPMIVRNRSMPLPRYRLLHPEARLSDSDIDHLSQWTRTERDRLPSTHTWGVGAVHHR